MGLIRFFSFDPRATRLRWAAWFAAVLLGTMLCAVAIARSEGIALVLLYGIIGTLGGKLVTESVRRLHDCDQSGMVGLAPAIGIVALLAFALLHWVGHGPGVVPWSLSGLAVLAIGVLLLRPGTAGVNRYGPVPSPLASTGQGTSKPGGLVAVGLIVAGLAFGFTVLRWQQDVPRQSEERTNPAFGRADRPDPFADVPGTRADPLAVPSADPSVDPLANSLDDQNAALSNRIDALLNSGGTQ